MQRRFPGSGYEELDIEVLGARVHCLHAGSGRPMLFLHGLVGSSLNWRRNLGALSRQASVYAIDQLNMGRSQRVRGLDAGLEATADRVAAMMTALGLDEADIVGHSHGGAVAMMVAARHRRRVRSLVLFAPANPYSNLSDFLVRVYSTPLGGLAAGSAPYFPEPLQRLALGRMYGDPARMADGSLHGYMNGLRTPGTIRHILAIVRRWFADMGGLKAVLPSLASVPTQLVWGDRDRAVSLDSGRRLKRELGQSELAVVRGGGHVLFEEMPQQANRVMLDWLGRDLPLAASRPRTASRPASLATQAVAAAMRRLPESYGVPSSPNVS